MPLDRLYQLLGLRQGAPAKDLKASLVKLGLDWPFPNYPGSKTHQEPAGLRAVIQKLVCQVEGHRLDLIEGPLEKIDFIIGRIKVTHRKPSAEEELSLETLDSQINSRLDEKFQQAHDWIQRFV